ncbi:hypothetical protein GCM10012290_01410 [Halolactibacillus alkaliphilus]|uniref:DUF624 domain-containing protein n=1 Tax=Halolactibacillus alkaliphilus TaxID=442899 RepID=A0A511X0P4_9BACI|nr:DUF624 domain-containing protein [Halolactibacillus alkaliphilus]GEN56491.1 hypothetical protein HAL01_09550 [Halolactibacillus alkaliphilus]GGN64197.1 hypothetical protein GCM10012290_01410 [Halolactibacillus alkaliphilus]SFO61700.1 Uncharacterized membrane protein YesL [Halolactibacillus alkaliphilus]
MDLKGIKGRLYNFGEFVTALAYLNFMWILFTFLGGVLLGVHPSTVALFASLRKWKEEGVYTIGFKEFKNEFKKEFKDANILGAYLTAILLMLIFNGFLIFLNQSMVNIFLNVVYFLSVVLTMILFIYVYAVYDYFEKKAVTTVVYAVVIGMANPLVTIKLILLIFLLGIAIYSTAGVPIFFGISAISYIIMKNARRIFMKLESRSIALG